MQVSKGVPLLTLASEYNDPRPCQDGCMRIPGCRGSALDLRLNPATCIQVQDMSVIQIDIPLFLSTIVMTLYHISIVRTIHQSRESKHRSKSLNALPLDWVGLLRSEGMPRTTSSLVRVLLNILINGSYSYLVEPSAIRGTAALVAASCAVRRSGCSMEVGMILPFIFNCRLYLYIYILPKTNPFFSS